ncbi:ParA family protein [Antarcticirhabdus aurantiaca]|uniref:ParA family protein n=1 Tax=Antarcticirhabdus aurantiaca TaxID=2606717 RepID=A0ACD4NUE1_9HYPH|nr:ParA family protein [Antarcticirhabdus aurantiaca]WAJ30373.1 ParA family protein [Jeongeuplla avenae]
MLKYAFWNNKGGTGKTSLAFQAITRYAELHPQTRILVVDMCPQANMSELLLGGMTNGGGNKLLLQQGRIPRCSIGGYFQIRLPSPYSVPAFNPMDYVMQPHSQNTAVPANISLVCGDPLLELQSNAINTLSNTQIPGTDTWIAVADWLRDFLNPLANDFDVVFIDCNPSFSLYTQIALATVDRLVLPVMADDSSRRAVQNALSLVYGLSLPSPIYATYAFSAKLRAAGRQLPLVHMIAKNRITQYMGPASAYAAVLHAIEVDIANLQLGHPQLFTFNNLHDGTVSIRDFQTTGVVAFARGLPFSQLKSGKQTVGGHRVEVNEPYRQNCLQAIDEMVMKL